MGGTRTAARARRWARGGSLIAAFLGLAAPAAAAPGLVKVGDFAQPVHATGPPGDGSRVFVSEKPGALRLVRDGVVLARPFLDLTAIVSSGGERGLLSAAFAPDYAASGRFYVFITATAAASSTGEGELQVREYRRSAADPDVADPATGRLLLAIDHDASNHNGGQLQFGPDGKLWLATGDGAAETNAQDPGSLLGKVIRLDPAAPAPEIVSSGLRNPWRFSFDRATGQIVIGDVGDGSVEEISFGLAANYGWPCFEGSMPHSANPACATGSAPPAVERTHLEGYSAIVGGYVVRDPGLPTLLGRYLYGDISVPDVRAVDLYGGAGDVAAGFAVANLSSFGEDGCGRLLVASLSGPVHRIVDGALSACPAGAGPPPATPQPPRDARACRVSARVSGLRSVRRLKRLTVTLRTDEACRATASARIRGVATFRTVRRSLVDGRRSVVRLRLTARGTRSVRRALARRSSLRVEVRVRAVDAAGNTRTLTRAARVRG
jgi:glucose/arabinose dehydrogenase